jgi:hypothetical protein
MNIAVLGWGSLIWDPRGLTMRSRWHRDGPMLPIEFARISNNGRLTLVIHPPSAEQQTYWALSALDTVDKAREDLKKREGTTLGHIHFASRGMLRDEHDPIEAAVQSWLCLHPQLDGAVWTGLPATLEGPDLVSKAVVYLTSLVPGSDAYEPSREYVMKTPSQVQTAVRREMQKQEWADAELSSDLFER